MGKGTPLPPDIEKGSRSHRPHSSTHHHNHHHAPLPPPPRQPPPQPWFPWLVPIIFFVDVGIFIYTMYLNDCPSREGENCTFYSDMGRLSFEPFEANPLLGPTITTLEQLGGLEKLLVVENNEPWRLVTCIWLHAGVVHLGANMLSLLVVGVGLEQEFGFFKFGVLYVLSGIGGSLLSAVMDDTETRISVGASGSLFGLLGAMLSELITNWTIYANKCTALSTLIVVVILNLGMGILIPHVDNSAHIGGFIAGFLLGFILLIRPQYGYVSQRYLPTGYDMKRRKSKYKCYQSCLWVIALVLLVVGFVSGLGALFNVQKVEDISL